MAEYRGQIPNDKDKCFCPTCKKTLQSKSFYTYKDGSKANQCKKCLTMHVQSFEPETFLWILEDFDVPYIATEWNILRDKAYAKDPRNVNGPKVLGKYFSKMKLKQWKDYSWADTERIAEEQKEREEQAMKETKLADEEFQEQLKEKLENGEISEAEYKTLMPTEVQVEDIQAISEQEVVEELEAEPIVEPAVDLDKIPDPSRDLDEESLIYLVAKWGETYSARDLFALEKNFMDMMNSFDIQDKDTENTLKLICKLDLKVNQALDIGDIDEMQKLARTLDPMRKSAKFTAAQNKENNSEFIDSMGELVDFCESQGGAIPPLDIDTPQDKIDVIIQDMKDYNKSLIYEDQSLARMIEEHIRKKEMIMKQKLKRQLGDDYKEDDLQDKDFIDFLESEEKDIQDDHEILEGEE